MSRGTLASSSNRGCNRKLQLQQMISRRTFKANLSASFCFLPVSAGLSAAVFRQHDLSILATVLHTLHTLTVLKIPNFSNQQAMVNQK